MSDSGKINECCGASFGHGRTCPGQQPMTDQTLFGDNPKADAVFHNPALSVKDKITALKGYPGQESRIEHLRSTTGEPTEYEPFKPIAGRKLSEMFKEVK